MKKKKLKRRIHEAAIIMVTREYTYTTDADKCLNLWKQNYGSLSDKDIPAIHYELFKELGLDRYKSHIYLLIEDYEEIIRGHIIRNKNA
jgi:hypothetical protein